MKGILGKKLGMTHLYNAHGRQVPVTVVEAGPCPVLARRTQEVNGYSAVQLGFGKRALKNVPKAVQGHVAAAGLTESAPAWIREIRLTSDPDSDVGDTVACTVFRPNEYVDVTGTSKGRGFQGVVKRWNFGGGRASHGGGWTRRPGSIGMCEKPGKVYKGHKMPGRMGNVRRTVQNLRVVQVRPDVNVILIEGAIPGPNGGFVIVREAKKRPTEGQSK